MFILGFVEFEHIIWKINVLKSKWLFTIYFFLNIPIQKGTFDIHLEATWTHEYYKCYEDSNSLYSTNRGKYIIIVDAFFLIIPLKNKSRLVSSYTHSRQA